MTSKLQVTLPKALATEYRIRPGDDIAWEGGGDVIRIVPGGRGAAVPEVAERLRRFDQATARQRRRQRTGQKGAATDRGWTRETLYERGRAR